jgi:hypothetical protein
MAQMFSASLPATEFNVHTQRNWFSGLLWVHRCPITECVVRGVRGTVVDDRRLADDRFRECRRGSERDKSDY